MRNDSQASLSGSSPPYAQYTYTPIPGKTKKTKSEALAAGFTLCIGQLLCKLTLYSLIDLFKRSSCFFDWSFDLSLTGLYIVSSRLQKTTNFFSESWLYIRRPLATIFGQWLTNSSNVSLNVSRFLSQLIIPDSEQGSLCLITVAHKLGIISTFSHYFYLERMVVNIGMDIMNSASESSSSVCLKSCSPLFLLKFFP